jgi:hypothetical protein
MSSRTSRSARRYASWALVLACLALAGCGSSSSPKTSSSAAPPPTSSSSSSSSAGGIPQGPNAGDKDSDNSGGPSDGDGNL